MTVIYEKTQINEVIEKLKEGKVIAFPTDTVYGLGVRYHDEEALTRLKQAKGRPENKPIPTMVANKEQLAAVAHLNEDIEKTFIHCLLPYLLSCRDYDAPYIRGYLPSLEDLRCGPHVADSSIRAASDYDLVDVD